MSAAVLFIGTVRPPLSAALMVKRRCRSLGNPPGHAPPGPWRHRWITGTGTNVPRRVGRRKRKKCNNRSGRGRGRGRRRRSSLSRITAEASVTPLPIRSQVPGVISGSPAPQRLLYGRRDDENKKTQQSIGDREKTRAAVTLPSVKHRHRSLDKPLADPFPGPWSSRRLTDTGTKASRRA